MSTVESTASHMRSEGNSQSDPITIRKLVSDPQFQSGYCDRLHGRPPRRFYYDEDAGEWDTWGYERGRAVATWLLTTGQKPPEADAVDELRQAYLAARAADAML